MDVMKARCQGLQAPEIMFKVQCVQTWHLAEWARLCSLTQRTQGVSGMNLHLNLHSYNPVLPRKESRL